MKRGTKILLALLVLCVALSVGFLWMQRGQSERILLARVIQSGQVVQEIRLDKVDAPYSFALEQNAQSNTIAVERGRIRMSHATCPDHLCVGQGWISSSALPIVCLPHHVVIEVIGGEDVLDAITG